MADALKLNILQFHAPTPSNSPSASNFTCDANNDGVAFIFQPYSADPITHLGFRYGARTGTPPTYLIRLEGVDASGDPDNADVGGGSATAVTFTPPADTTINGLWQWKALTNSYTPTRGQMLASVIRYSSGTIDGSNNSSFTRALTSTEQASLAMPYADTMDAGAWTKRLAPVFGWRTASGRFGIIGQAGYATSTANTAGHRSGAHFTLPSGSGDTFKVLGLKIAGDPGAGSGTTIVGIWDTSWNLIQGITIDADQLAAAASSPFTIIFDDTNLTALSYGTKYYAGFEVIAGSVGIYGLTLAEADDRSAFPNGTNMGLVTYNGSTTETDTVMPNIALILDDITEPAGGGGMLVHPGLNGGLRG